ncbi:MAG: hypothetical protein ABEJ86_07525 [Halococcoides sp.]
MNLLRSGAEEWRATSVRSPDEVRGAVDSDAECTTSFEATEALVDISRAEEVLDWEPQVSWRDRV